MKKLEIESRAREGLSRYYQSFKDAGYIRDFEIGKAFAAPVQDDGANLLAMALLEGIGVDFEPQWNVVVEATVVMDPPPAKIHIQLMGPEDLDTGGDNAEPDVS